MTEKINEILSKIKLTDRTEEIENICYQCKNSGKPFVICQGCEINNLKQIFKAQKELDNEESK